RDVAPRQRAAGKRVLRVAVSERSGLAIPGEYHGLGARSGEGVMELEAPGGLVVGAGKHEDLIGEARPLADDGENARVLGGSQGEGRVEVRTVRALEGVDHEIGETAVDRELTDGDVAGALGGVIGLGAARSGAAGDEQRADDEAERFHGFPLLSL